MARFCVFALLISVLMLFPYGCGYTTSSLLPPHIKNIYIENFSNKISITDEVSDRKRYKTYRPKLEVDITEAIIDKYIYDGHLKVTQKKDADLILEGELIDFSREATKYGYDDNIEQYRIAIIINIKLTDVKQGSVMWEEKDFAGSSYYYTTGPQKKSEESAVTAAIDDLARRVVGRTIEVW